MQNITNWNEIAKIHHEAMVEKGFHKDYTHTDLLARGIAECGEAMSAWRKGRRANMKLYNTSDLHTTHDYEHCIKHTVEEELADIALIMLDFAATNGVKINPIGFVHLGAPIEILMRIVTFISNINYFTQNEYSEENDWKRITICVNSIFSNLLHLCKDLDIDLFEQVELKMKYNQTRPHRHGDSN